MDDLITVLMSVYNENEEILVQSIESVLNQTYTNIQFIIVNDNPDNPAINRVLGSVTDPRVIKIVNEKNIGLVKSLNKGLKIAEGKYIARMDADDVSKTERFEKQINYLKNQELDLVGAAINCIDEEGNYLNKLVKYPRKLTKNHNRWSQGVAHPTFFAKAEMYKELGGYRDISFCEDYDFICRGLYSGYNIGNINIPLLDYRVRANGISGANMYEQKVRSNYIGGLREDILNIGEKEIMAFTQSNEYIKEVQRCREYFEGKEMLLDKHYISGVKKIANKYLIYAIMRKIYGNRGK